MPIIPGLDDAAVLSGILHNARWQLQSMSESSFAQLFGPAGPRQGHPETDGIRFTPATCEQVYRHLREHGIHCVRIMLDMPGDPNHSILLAAGWTGIKNGITKAEKLAHRASYGQSRKVTCTVLDPAGDH